MNVVYLYPEGLEDQYGVQQRCFNLSRSLNRSGRHSASLVTIDAFLRHTPECQRLCWAADLLVIEKYLFGAVLARAGYWRQVGKKVIVDFDEALNLLTPDQPQYRFWVQGYPARFAPAPTGGLGDRIVPPPIDQFELGLHHVDGVSVPTARMAGDWPVQVPVIEVKDYLDIENLVTGRQVAHVAPVIGLGGERVSTRSVVESGLATALEAVCQCRPDVSVFISSADASLAGALKIHPSQTVIQGWVPVEDWPMYLSGIDIGLAPVSGAYELRKSPRRVLEYMRMRIPWIASNQLPYRELAPYGLLVANTPAAWETAILEVLARTEQYRERAAGEPYVYALSQDLDEHIEKVVASYATILREKVGILS